MSSDPLLPGFQDGDSGADTEPGFFIPRSVVDPVALRGMAAREMQQFRNVADQMTQQLRMLPTVNRGYHLVKKLTSLHKLSRMDEDQQETDLVVRGLMDYVSRLELKVKTKFVNLDRTYRRLRQLQSSSGVETNGKIDQGPSSSAASVTRNSSSSTNGIPRRSGWRGWMLFRWMENMHRKWRKFWKQVRRRNNIKGLAREVMLRLRCEEEVGEVTDFGNLEMVVAWYNAFLRVTFLYFIMMVLMMLVALGLGWTLVRVIDMFVTLQEPSYETSWAFLFVPFQVVIMSMGVSSMCSLFQDQVREVPLANVRATLLALHLRLFHPSRPYITVEQFVFTDMLFIVNSFVWPLIWWQPVVGAFVGVRGAAQAEIAGNLNQNWGFLDHDPRTGVAIYFLFVTISWLAARLGHLLLDFAAMCRREGSVDAGYLTYGIQRGILQTKMFVGTFLLDWLCNRHEEAFVLFQEESGLRRPAAQERQRAQRHEIDKELADTLKAKAGPWKSRTPQPPHGESEQDLVRFFQGQLRNPKVLKKCGTLYLDDLNHPPEGGAASLAAKKDGVVHRGHVRRERSKRGSFSVATEFESLLFQKLSLQEEQEAQNLLETRLRAIAWTLIWTLLWAFVVMVDFSIQAAVGSFVPVAGAIYIIVRCCGHHPCLVFVASMTFLAVFFMLCQDFMVELTPNDLDIYWSWRIVLMPGVVYVMQTNWLTIRGRKGTFAEVMTSILLVAPIIVVPFVEYERTDLKYQPYPIIGPGGMPSDFVTKSPYPICQLRWGGDAFRLNALDLGALTFYTYAQDFQQLEGLLNRSYEDVGWKLHKHLSSRTYSIPNASSSLQALPTVYVLDFPPPVAEATGTLVIAFRGTHTRRDFYADAASYTSVAILQMVQWYVFPILWDVPQRFIELALRKEQTHQQEHMVEAAVKQVEHIVSHFPDHEVVLIGHSLGGWFAEVIGIRLGLSAMSWSAMGVRLRTEAEKLTTRSHNKYVAVIPDGDFVPRIDIHSGLQQRIVCPRQAGEFKIMNITFQFTDLMTSLECHKVDRSTCELWRSCSDAAKRGFFCSGYVQPGDLGLDLPADVRRDLENLLSTPAGSASGAGV